MTSSAPPSVAIGDVIAGKYRVERVLGQGGMGIVVAAMHEQLGQRVALKMLLPSSTTSPDSVARFSREARAAVKIRGEHVSRILDVGELDSGAPYIVMEYLEGKDLAATLAESGPLPAETAVDYVLQACEALAEAHAAGIVHRDMKPSNVFVTRGPDGSPLIKVLDFGISKARATGDAASQGLTTTSSFIGSPVYAPPEQLVASRDVDGRADIWAVGTILYEALTGRTPFAGESVMQIASSIFHSAPVPLESVRPGIPEELAAVVLKCLQKRPDDRYADVRELAAALIPFSPGAEAAAARVARILGSSLPPPSPLADTVPATSSVPRPVSPPTPIAASTSTSPAFVGSQTGDSKPRRGLYALAVVGVAAALGIAFTLGRTTEPPPPPSTATSAPTTTSTPTPTLTSTSTSTSPSTSPSPLPSTATATLTPAADSAPTASASHTVPHAPSPAPHRSPLSVGVK